MQPKNLMRFLFRTFLHLFTSDLSLCMLVMNFSNSVAASTFAPILSTSLWIIKIYKLIILAHLVKLHTGFDLTDLGQNCIPFNRTRIFYVPSARLNPRPCGRLCVLMVARPAASLPGLRPENLGHSRLKLFSDYSGQIKHFSQRLHA